MEQQQLLNFTLRTYRTFKQDEGMKDLQDVSLKIFALNWPATKPNKKMKSDLITDISYTHHSCCWNRKKANLKSKFTKSRANSKKVFVCFQWFNECKSE
jgi:hypothetical protein